jgi:hypothetical protein
MEEQSSRWTGQLDGVTPWKNRIFFWSCDFYRNPDAPGFVDRLSTVQYALFKGLALMCNHALSVRRRLEEAMKIRRSLCAGWTA